MNVIKQIEQELIAKSELPAFGAGDTIIVSSPFIESITVVKRGAVRRARIFYFRERTGKSARIREKKNFSH